MAVVLDALAGKGVGLLMSIDEIDPKLDEFVQLVSVYQLFVREGRKVALLMAGLPHNASLLLQDRSVSFLRRAEPVRLGHIPDYRAREGVRLIRHAV